MRQVDTMAVYRSFLSAGRCFFENGPSLVTVSVLWFVGSLPVITMGPATLAAYSSAASIRKHGYVDRKYVLDVMTQHGVAAALLAGFPMVLAVIATLYIQRYLATGTTTTLVLGVVTTYAAVYVALVLIPSFIGLATGDDLESAIRTAVRWTAGNALAAITMAMATLLVALVTGLLTIAFVIVFAGFTVVFHFNVLLGPPDTDDGNLIPGIVKTDKSSQGN